jgi:hypothetical protein
LLNWSVRLNTEKCLNSRIENPRVRGSIPRLATKDTSVKTPIHVVGVFAFTRAKLCVPANCRSGRGLESFEGVFGGEAVMC